MQFFCVPLRSIGDLELPFVGIQLKSVEVEVFVSCAVKVSLYVWENELIISLYLAGYFNSLFQN